MIHRPRLKTGIDLELELNVTPCSSPASTVSAGSIGFGEDCRPDFLSSALNKFEAQLNVVPVIVPEVRRDCEHEARRPFIAGIVATSTKFFRIVRRQKRRSAAANT